MGGVLPFGDLYVAQCLSDVLGVIIMSYIHARLAYFLKAYIQTCLCTENLVMGNLMKFTQIIFGLEKAKVIQLDSLVQSPFLFQYVSEVVKYYYGLFYKKIVY